MLRNYRFHTQKDCQKAEFSSPHRLQNFVSDYVMQVLSVKLNLNT